MLRDQTKWHETDSDKERQFQILLAFTGAHNLSAIQTPDGSSFDAIIIRYPSKIACAEIKFRNHNFGTFATYTVDSKKLDAIWDYTELKNLKAFLIVSWRGNIRHAIVSRNFRYRKTVQKRSDRDEPPDEVYHIPISEFVEIS